MANIYKLYSWQTVVHMSQLHVEATVILLSHTTNHIQTVKGINTICIVAYYSAMKFRSPHFSTPSYNMNTLKLRHGRHFQTFSNSFSWKKITTRISIHISLKVPMCPIDNKSVLVQVMTWRRTGDKHYLNQCLPVNCRNARKHMML